MFDLTPEQIRELETELRPLLHPYLQHQGWITLSMANIATDVLIGIFKDMGVVLR